MPTTMSRIQDERLTGVLALVLAIGAMAYANFAAGGDNGGAGPFAVTTVVCAIVAALVFGRVVPSVSGSAAPAIWLAVLAVLTVLAFWSGLPIVLGIAALAAGARSGSGAGTAAGVVGVLAAAAATVACIIG